MKFGCLAVDCLDDLEIKELCDFLLKNGYFRFGRNEGYSLIAIDIDGTFYDLPSSDIVSKERKRITYQQFMEKYGMTDLQKKIEEAKNKTHMSLHQMSKAIGFNEHYLSGVVKRNRSEETQSKVIALLDGLIQKSQQELTHDFKGKALNTRVDDVVTIPKSEYSEMYSTNTALCFKVGNLEKELDYKTQVAEKHADMRANAEAELQIADEAIKQQLTNVASKLLIIGELENKMKEKDELIHLAEQDSEKWQGDYWTVSRENVELINSKRCISIWLAVSILIIVLMFAFGVLHFNGVV